MLVLLKWLPAEVEEEVLLLAPLLLLVLCELVVAVALLDVPPEIRHQNKQK